MPEKDSIFVWKSEDIEVIDDKEHIRYLISRAFPELKEIFNLKIDPLVAAQKRLIEER